MSDVNQAVRDVVKGASVVYVGLFLELVIAFVAQVLAAQYLSVSGFGGLTAGTALLDVGSIVAGLGLGSGLTRYFPRVQGAKKRILATYTVGITLVSSLVLGLAVALNASLIATAVFDSPNVAVSIRIFGAAIPFAALLNVGVGGIQGQERALYRVYVKNIIHPIARFALVIGAITIGLDQAGLAGAYAVPYVVSASVALFLLHRTLPRAKPSFDGELFSEMTRYSLPFVVSGISSFIYRSIDIFLILYFIGDAATGVYGVAYAAVSFMGMYSTAFNFLGSPIASKLEHDGNVDGAMRMFGSATRWLVVASVCTLVPLGVFSTDFIGIIYKPAYEAGGLALAILAVGFAAKNVLCIHGPILEAVGRSKTLSFNSAASAVTNLVLNVALIPRFGIEGAAVATVLSFMVRDGLATVQVGYELGSTPVARGAVRPLALGIPFLGVFAAVVAPEIPTTLLWLVGTTGLFSLCYVVAVVVTFGLSETEVMIIRSAEERYGIDLGPIDPLIQRLADR